MPVLADNGKHNPIAEVTDFLKLEVQLLVEPEPLIEEVTYRHSPLEVVFQRLPGRKLRQWSRQRRVYAHKSAPHTFPSALDSPTGI